MFKLKKHLDHPQTQERYLNSIKENKMSSDISL